MLFKFLNKGKIERSEPLRAVGVLRHAHTEMQPKVISRWCRRNIATVVELIEEDFPLDSPWDRPELGKWLTTEPPKNWDVLVASRMDRVTVVERYGLDLIEWCRDHSKRLILVEEKIDSDEWIRPATLASLFPDDPHIQTR